MGDHSPGRNKSVGNQDNNPAKKHHYVPQVYLRGFAEERERGERRSLYYANVERIGVKAGATGAPPIKTNIVDIASQNHFYTIPQWHDIDGLDPLHYEEWFGTEIESAVGEVLKKRGSGETLETLTDDDFKTLAKFIAAQVLRGPDMRKAMDENLGRYFRLHGITEREHLRHFLEQLFPFEDESEREIAANRLWKQATGDANREDKRNMAIIHLHHALAEVEPLSQRLLDGYWTFTHYEEPLLITSDSPVSLEPDPFHLSGPVTLGNASGLALPLTAHMSLDITFNNPGVTAQDERHTVGVGSKDSADRFNERTRANAHSMVISLPSLTH